MIHLKLLNAFNINVIYICDINDYLYIDDPSCLQNIDLYTPISEDDFLSFIDTFFPERYSEIDNRITNMSISNNMGNEYTICIHPSRKCNLQCKYCFGDSDYLPQDEISIETAKDAIDFLVYNYGANGSMYTVDLSGSGEPFLRLDFIKELDRYCDELRNKTGKQILIKFATNATVITNEVCEFLKSCKCVIYGVSIDGNERQNSNRLFKNQNPTYNDVIQSIDIINNGLLGLAVTITNKNEEVDEIYSHLYSFNPSAISMHYVRDFSNREVSMYKINIENLLSHYDNLFSLFLNKIEDGDFEYIMPLIRGDDLLGIMIKKSFFKGVIPKYRCPAGKTKITVNHKGDLYACSVMNGNKDFYIGNIYSGVDKNSQEKFYYSNVAMSLKCRECWCRNICAGECMANSYLHSEYLFEPIEFLCDIKKALIAKAIPFVEYLRLNHKQSFQSIYKFVIGSATYVNSDSAIWATLYFLKERGKNIPYSSVSESLNRLNRNDYTLFDNGIHPKCLELFIKKHDYKICSVVIENYNIKGHIQKYPVIAYLNKDKSYYHKYYIITDIDDYYVYYKSLQSDFLNKQNIGDFLNYSSNIFIGDFKNIN